MDSSKSRLSERGAVGLAVGAGVGSGPGSLVGARLGAGFGSGAAAGGPLVVVVELAAAFFGLPVEELINLNLCGYFSTSIVGEVGQTYSLSVSVNAETYTSVTSILQPTALDTLYWKPEPSLVDHGWSWATLSDPPGSFDAYLWEVQRLNTLPDGTKDPIVYKPFGPYFDDAFFDGLTSMRSMRALTRER